MSIYILTVFFLKGYSFNVKVFIIQVNDLRRYCTFPLFSNNKTSSLASSVHTLSAQILAGEISSLEADKIWVDFRNIRQSGSEHYQRSFYNLALT